MHFHCVIALADAAEKAVPGALGGLNWKEIIVSLVGLLITAFLVPYLKQQASAAKAAAEKDVVDASKSLIEQKGALATRVKSYLWGSAAAIAEKEFPQLAEKIAANELKSIKEVKEVLYGWGKVLKAEAITYFGKQGIDLVAAFGDQALDKLIERAANAVSPFPGRDTAKTLLQEKVSNMLIEKGVEWVKNHYLSDKEV